MPDEPAHWESRGFEPLATSDETEGRGMAERKGFEPLVRFPVHTLSKRAPSTTRTSLRSSGLISLTLALAHHLECGLFACSAKVCAIFSATANVSA